MTRRVQGARLKARMASCEYVIQTLERYMCRAAERGDSEGVIQGYVSSIRAYREVLRGLSAEEG